MPKPPLLPAEIVRRLIRVARFHGYSVLIFTGLFTLGALALGDFKSTLICALITAAGAFEVNGARLLARGESRGIVWLVRSPIYLLTVLLLYVGWQLLTYNSAQAQQVLDPAMKAAGMQEQLDALGATQEDLKHMTSVLYFASYGLVALVSFFYLGALALYYHRRRGAVLAAFSPIKK
jgi:hypothetical protein